MSATIATDQPGLRSAGGVLITPLGGWPAESEQKPACLRSAGGVPIKPFSGKTTQTKETQDPARAPQKKGLIARIIDKLLGRN